MDPFGSRVERTLTRERQFSENSCKVTLDSPLVLLLGACLLDEPEKNKLLFSVNDTSVGRRKLKSYIEHISQLYYVPLKITI